ncbi:MAG: hypothetical protein LVQ64_00865 [Thermoplasmatales archaeon]|nr:hypothetical protein [Thermoplasmatales archaeon]
MKSRAEVFGRSPSFRITLSCRTVNREAVERLLLEAQGDLEQTLAAHKILLVDDG